MIYLCLSLNHVNLCRLCPSCLFEGLLGRHPHHLREDAQLPEHVPGARSDGRALQLGVPQPGALLPVLAPQLLPLGNECFGLGHQQWEWGNG